MGTRLFVYGTLRKGGRLHGNLNDAEFIGMASLPGFSMYDVGAFPAVVMVQDREQRHNTPPVRGELYDISGATRQRLDWVEGYHPEDRHSSLYVRTYGEVQIDDKYDKYGDKFVSCEVYVWNGPVEGLTPIPEGDYMEYIKKGKGG